MTLKLNGSSSGYTAINAPAAAGSNTLVLPTNNGSNGQFLQTNGSGVMSWAGAGKVLQVQVGSSTSVADAGADATWTQVGPTVAITPSAATSKVLICLNAWAIVKNIGEFGHNLYRTIGGTEGDLIQWWGEAADDSWMPMNMHALYYDSPNTTSEITYKTRIYCVSNHGSFRFNYQKSGAGAATAQYIAIEVAG